MNQPLSFQNILVTGGCGFIGTNFIRYLFEEAGFQGRVVNLDVLTYAANPANLADIAEKYGDRYVFVKADICDREAVSAVLDRYGIDAIAHFAAESHVDRSIVRPDDFIRTNINGTYNLLQLARERGDQIRRFHHVSTDEVFGSLGPTGYFTEDTQYSPNSPYSASKASSDHLVRAYHSTYGLPVTVTNCSNNYGPYQFPEKLIPLMILNAAEGKALPVYGDGMNIRDWLYVRDHAAAIWLVMTQGESGRTYCVGGRSERTNIDIVHHVCDWVDKLEPALADKASRRDLITFVKDRPGHDRRYAIDCTRVETELGWRAEETFETGFEKTVRWYLSHREWVDSVRSGEYRNWIEQNYARR